ncbi:MAG: flagellar hook-associated protein 3 [Sphingomonas sp. SCN 67-18]|uniref:flagellar hook-associated protein FlgL n=1 Tax=uncultured Sphingomonas sp. TaxID=158754 RepID=UPI00086E50A1|nr:flagellar hook-associated protein FlgL [Sphingomonas sp. SCN 67-18]ODU21572.1 MAG: flagellar hook-associated protein 3 [Sphingomonas sp. SCN 67-18]
MQIGTQYSFERAIAQMRTLSGNAARLQDQVTSGKRVTSPSVDPLASARLTLLARKNSNETQFASNVTLASSLLGQADVALEGVQTQIQRAAELALRASNDTMNDSDRAAIGIELQAIVDDLLTLANSSDIRGASLFGGASTGQAFVRNPDGSVSYAGQGDPPPIPIGDNVSIAATDSGERIFTGIDSGSGPRDLFAIVSTLAAALQAGSAPDPAALRDAINEGIAGLNAASEHIASARASVGARGARLDLESERLAQLKNENEIERTGLEGVDMQSSIAELQQNLLTLQATQASFAKLSQLSLFDYLR